MTDNVFQKSYIFKEIFKTLSCSNDNFVASVAKYSSVSLSMPIVSYHDVYVRSLPLPLRLWLK